MVATQAMNHLFFPRAEEFIPERWVKNSVLEKEAKKWCYLPFGFGTRKCIGFRIAELEIYCLAIHMFKKYGRLIDNF